MIEEQSDFLKKLETRPVDNNTQEEDNGCIVGEEPLGIPEEHILLTSEEETYEKPERYVLPPQKPKLHKIEPHKEDPKENIPWYRDIDRF